MWEKKRHIIYEKWQIMKKMCNLFTIFCIFIVLLCDLQILLFLFNKVTSCVWPNDILKRKNDMNINWQMMKKDVTNL